MTKEEYNARKRTQRAAMLARMTEQERAEWRARMTEKRRVQKLAPLFEEFGLVAASIRGQALIPPPDPVEELPFTWASDWTRVTAELRGEEIIVEELPRSKPTHSRWESWQDELIMSHQQKDKDLAPIIGRSIKAIEVRRAKLRRERT